jgi:hypothetical protein
VHRASALAVACLALTACGSGQREPHRAAPASVVRLAPAADAYVAPGRGAHGYGPTLRVGGARGARSYLEFDLAALSGRVAGAQLRVYGVTGSRDGYEATAATGARWKGQRLLAAPAGGTSGAAARGFRPRRWTSVDVTSLVRAGETTTIRLRSRAPREITLASSESGATAPQLVVRLITRPGPSGFLGRVGVPRGATPVVGAAGDIACDPASPDFHQGRGTGAACVMGRTAGLVERLRPATVLALGDNQYEDNAYAKYLASYAPTWGRFKALIHPAIGNHEYATPRAAGYFRYFGAAAGTPGQGYYSFDLGAWHLVALNSECAFIGGCGLGSPEETWLRADLAAHPAACTLAYWHEPRFSSGQHGDNQQMAAIFNDLVAAHADLVLSGHNHDYERFAPIGRTPSAPMAPGKKSLQPPHLDPAGIREFVVGTGGRNLYAFHSPTLGGEIVRNADTFGVLDLRLEPHGYQWAFVPVGGASGTFRDAGSGRCH